MKKLLLITILLIGIQLPSFAETAREFKKFCSSSLDYSEGYCIGYIVGMLEGISVGSSIERTIKSNATMGTVRDTVLKYLWDNPKDGDEIRVLIVADALIDAGFAKWKDPKPVKKG